MRWLCGVIIVLSAVCYARMAREPLFLAPLYVEYSTSSTEEFAREARELKERIGQGPGVVVGFSAFLNTSFRASDFDDVDRIVERARTNNLPIHISIISGFFHGRNTLRDAAIREDVRNAQWFSDGFIAAPEELRSRRAIPRSVWITPSRHARSLRTRMEEHVRLLGKHLAEAMERFPDTLVSISGDSEVELSYERNLEGGERPQRAGVLYADYSPFMIAEFRDWLRTTRYAGDESPATDENRDGHTLNKDYGQSFSTWRLRYFDESGPIPYAKYLAMPEKLHQGGEYFVDSGFDAPRNAQPGKAFWEAWKKFRTLVISNYVHDFAGWITANSRIPASRFYTHQIPAEFLFDGKDNVRLETSASLLATAFIKPLGSSGVTVFDTYNGKTYSKTSNAAMFKQLERSSPHWGILEYNPSVPPTGDENYYTSELRNLHAFHPSIIVPFAWTNVEHHARYRIKGSAFERALRKFAETLR